MTAKIKTSKDEVQITTSKAWPRIYVGPSLPRGKLVKNTVFAEAYPAHIAELIKAHPTIDQLIVPTSKLQKAKLELAQKGSLLNELSKKIINEFKGV